jgi:hypothetical protein
VLLQLLWLCSGLCSNQSTTSNQSQTTYLNHVPVKQVIPYQLPSGEEAPGRVKVSKPGRLVISASGKHIAAMDRNSLFVWAAGSSAAGKRAKPLNLPHTKPYTVRQFEAGRHD